LKACDRGRVFEEEQMRISVLVLAAAVAIGTAACGDSGTGQTGDQGAARDTVGTVGRQPPAEPGTSPVDSDRAAQAAEGDATLPKTASPLPAIGLAGTAALAGAAGLRLARRTR
jgi:hypothetical protein